MSFASFTGSISQPISTAGVRISADGGGFTRSKGSWSELVASLAFDACAIMIYPVGHHGAGSSTQVLFDVAIGSAGSEVLVLRDIMAVNGIGTPRSLTRAYWWPVRLPRGSRIAARVVSSYTTIGATENHTFAFAFVPSSGRYPIGVPSFDAFNVGSGTGTGGDVQGGASDTDFGAWVEVSPSTPRRYTMAALCARRLSTTSTWSVSGHTVEVGVGAAGFEEPVAEFYHTLSSDINVHTSISATPITLIPAGSRVSIRTTGSPDVETRMNNPILYLG